MKCSVLYEALKNISQGLSPSSDATDEMIRLGMIVKVSSQPGVIEELDVLKKKLSNVKYRIKALRGEIYIEGQMEDIEFLSQRQRDAQAEKLLEQEVDLRAKILDLVQKTPQAITIGIGDGKIAITYSGREVMQILEARLPLASDIEWGDIITGLEKLKTKLASEAREAAQILKVISPELDFIDEHHLRSAAVGLASLDGSPDSKTDMFIKYASSEGAREIFDSKFLAIAAESAVVYELEKNAPPDYILTDMSVLMSELPADGWKTVSQRESVAVMMMAKPREQQSELIRGMIDEYNFTGDLLAGALLRLVNPADDELDVIRSGYRFWNERLIPRNPSEDNDDPNIASAILATAMVDGSILSERFDTVQEYMRQLFEEDMFTASAMITLWPASIGESLDNIRIASSQILANKLSVGGVENFSLGMKLLTNNAIFISLGRDASGMTMVAREVSSTASSALPAIAVGATGAALIASPLLARMPFTVFHAVTLHRDAERDFRYHPVHTSYLYG